MGVQSGVVAGMSVALSALLTACAGSDARPTTPPGTKPVIGFERDLVELPVRDGPLRQTTNGVPHVQLGAEPVPVVDAELRRRAFLLPGVEDRASIRSLPGARGLSLASDVELVRADVLGGSREFAHIHPDGSLHVWLPVERAVEVDRTGWGQIHPWADRDGFWDGVVMVFTPETHDELDVTMRIIVDAYNFVTGDELDPDAFR